MALIAVIIVLFLNFVDTQSVWIQLSALDWRLALAASAMLVLALLLHGALWRHLLSNQVRLSSTFHAGNICQAMNMWLPLRPGEPARIIILGEDEAVSMAKVTGTVIVDRWLDNVMRLIFTAIAISIGLGVGSSTWTIGGAASLVLAFLILMLLMVRFRVSILATWPRYLARIPKLSEERARHFLAGIVEGLQGVTSLRQLLILLGWAALVWISLAGYHYLTLRALGVSLEPRLMWTLALGTLALAPPTAATQPGLYHASIVAPLTVVGFDPELLTAYAIVLHLLQNVWITALAVWGAVAARESIGKVLSDVRGLFERGQTSETVARQATERAAEFDGAIPVTEEV